MRFLLLISLLLIITNHSFSQAIKSVDNTANAGKVEWSTRQILMEDLPFGKPATREFTVKNISKEVMQLLEVKPSCVCTTVEYNTDPVQPGEARVITVTYDAAKEGAFYRIVTVKTSFDPNESVAIVINGNVLPKPMPAGQ